MRTGRPIPPLTISSDERETLFGVLQSVQAVPEPSSMALELAAVVLLAGRWAWRNRRRTDRA